MSLRNQVCPGVSRRDDFPFQPDKTALLIIDVQKYLTTPNASDSDNAYFWDDAVPRMLTNLQLLVESFRKIRDASDRAGCEVIFTFLQAATKDGRDISLDYKLSGPALANIPRVGETDLFLEDLQPSLQGKGDILLPKTSCSVFQSTNLDYLLRNLNIEQLVVTGQLTDQCVESAVRDAADLGYFVTLAEDACAAKCRQSHQKGLSGMQGFGRIVNTRQVVAEITAAKPAVVPTNPTLQASLATEEGILDYLRARGLVDEARDLAKALKKKRREG